MPDARQKATLLLMFVPRKMASLLERVLPRSVSVFLHRIYHPYYCWQARRLTRRLLRQLFPSGELTVIGGPFKGMRYVSASSGSALVPKLLGSYEEELRGAFAATLDRRYEVIIDIGCAEGYYLVGLALKFPTAIVHGFDLDERALAGSKALSELNGVADRVRLHGRCTPENLAPLLTGRALIVSDCEGAEVQLLDPQAAPGLRRADLIVELHDRLVPGTTSSIERRFRETHKVEILHAQNRDVRGYPFLSSLNPKDQRLALDEFRSDDMTWAFISTP